MKVAIVTANFGGYDKVHPVKEQTIDCDYYYFTEKNSPYPLAGLNDRMKAKFFKLQSWSLFLFHDVVIWHDASFRIESPDFASWMISQLKPDDQLVLPIHPKRPNLEEELLFIMDGLKDKDPYLCAKYNPAAIKAEYEFILEHGAQDLTLFACGLMAYRNSTAGIGQAFNHWWELVLKYSEFDQCMFSVAFRHFSKSRFEFNEPFNKNLISKTEHERH